MSFDTPPNPLPPAHAAPPWMGLDRNEWQFNHPVTVHQQLATGFGPSVASRYSDPTHAKAFLTQLIDAFDWQCSPHSLALTHGAEDALWKLLALAKPQYQNLIIHDYSWGSYEFIAKNMGYYVKKIPLLNPHEYDLAHPKPTALRSSAELCAGIHATLGTQAQGPSVVLAASPNNPTAHQISLIHWCDLARAHPQHVFILDGVYGNLAEGAFGFMNTAPDNVVLVGSMSKFFGIPGLRLGWARFSGHNPIIRPHAMGLPLGFCDGVLKTAQVCLEQKSFYQECHEHMAQSALALVEQVRLLGAEAWHMPPAPFILIPLPQTQRHWPEAHTRAQERAKVRTKFWEQDNGFWVRISLGDRRVTQAIGVYVQHLLK